MAAENSGGEEQMQELVLNFNGNGSSQSPSNEILGELESSCESSLTPSLNLSINFSLSTSALLLQNFQMNSPSSDETTESSTPQSRPTNIVENPMVAAGNNELLQAAFMFNAPGLMQIEAEAPNFGDALMDAPPHPFFSSQEEMVTQNTGIFAYSFPPYPEPLSSHELLQPQTPFSQSYSLYGSQSGLSIQQYNMLNSYGEQKAQLYPQTAMGTTDGRSPWFSSQNTAPYRSITAPSGSRYNQFVGSNVLGSLNSYSFMTNPSLQSRPLQSSFWNQLPAMSNSYDPYYHAYPMPPAPPLYSRFQSSSYPYSQQVSTEPGFYDTQGWNSMPPLDHSFQFRTQNYGHHQVQYGMNSQYYNSVLPTPSMPSRFQQFNNYNQNVSSVKFGMPNVSDLQNDTNPRQEPLLLPGPAQATDVQQGLMQQQQQFSIDAPIMSSFSQPLMDRGQVNVSTAAAVPLQDATVVSGTSATPKPPTSQPQEQSRNQQPQVLTPEAQEGSVTGRLSPKRNRLEIGESSSSTCKRIKRESTTTETRPSGASPPRVNGNTGASAQENVGTSRAANTRGIKSEIYDPIFEEMGLPIDPHLRMFLLS